MAEHWRLKPEALGSILYLLYKQLLNTHTEVLLCLCIDCHNNIDYQWREVHVDKKPDTTAPPSSNLTAV